MSNPDKADVPYTAETDTTGGRDGASRSSDGRLEVKLSRPGSHGSGPKRHTASTEIKG